MPDQLKWDRHFITLALENARMSKDPATQAGAIIVGPDREVRSMGYNGLPRGIADTPERLENKELKRSLVVHAEMNAILNAARIGVSTRGCVLYLALTDESGEVWGGPPCARCTVEIIQAGITEIVAKPFKMKTSYWKDSVEQARSLLEEAEIHYREIAS
ncbi:deoxycytidylate deaminase [Roseimaritima sediminicola]|uniref:deoxycytidylate deaminase n=1 Tax=Roseimaritima sediminicola TaxID=2662066 RepID=UPI00129847A9|nr:deaminase [Roseimaritima sediminicola]